MLKEISGPFGDTIIAQLFKKSGNNQGSLLAGGGWGGPRPKVCTASRLLPHSQLTTSYVTRWQSSLSHHHRLRWEHTSASPTLPLDRGAWSGPWSAHRVTQKDECQQCLQFGCAISRHTQIHLPSINPLNQFI